MSMVYVSVSVSVSVLLTARALPHGRCCRARASWSTTRPRRPRSEKSSSAPTSTPRASTSSVPDTSRFPSLLLLDVSDPRVPACVSLQRSVSHMEGSVFASARQVTAATVSEVDLKYIDAVRTQKPYPVVIKI
eukprot:2270731-Rhodomonas_salina.1